MRIQWIAAIAALALLGGCNNADQSAAPGQAATPAIAPGSTITGTVTLREPVAVAAGKLDIKLVDIATPELPVAEKVVDANGMPPFNFSIDFEPARISAARTYVVNVVLTDGERRFMPALNSPVLTQGAGTTTQVVLIAEPTAGEKAKESFEKLKSAIGGMRKVEGTYTTETASIGWDAFYEGGVVRYIRVNTVFDEGGRSAVHYAYQDGKLMAVEERRGASVGWDGNGQVTWNQRPGGETVDEAGLEAMKAEAARVQQMAQEKVDAARKK